MKKNKKLKKLDSEFYDYVCEPKSFVRPGNERILITCFLPKAIIFVFRGKSDGNYEFIEKCELPYFVGMNSKYPGGFIRVKDPETKELVCSVPVTGMEEYLETCMRLVAQLDKEKSKGPTED